MTSRSSRHCAAPFRFHVTARGVAHLLIALALAPTPAAFAQTPAAAETTAGTSADTAADTSADDAGLATARPDASAASDANSESATPTARETEDATATAEDVDAPDTPPEAIPADATGPFGAPAGDGPGDSATGADDGDTAGDGATADDAVVTQAGQEDDGAGATADEDAPRSASPGRAPAPEGEPSTAAAPEDAEATDGDGPDDGSAAGTSELEARLQALGARQAAARAEAEAALASRNDEFEALAARVERLSARLERQGNRLDASPDGDAAARVLALAVHAETSLAVRGDATDAVAALEHARRVASASPRREALEGPIDDTLAALAGLVGEDEVPGRRADLARRCQSIATLSPRPPPAPKKPLEAVTEAEPQPVEGWRGVLGGLWRDLMNQVSVRSADEADPIVGPAQVSHARVALYGLCDAIDEALGARDGRRVSRYARTAAGIAGATFDPTDEAVEGFVGFFEQLAGLDIAPFPDLSGLVDAATRAMVAAPDADGAR